MYTHAHTHTHTWVKVRVNLMFIVLYCSTHLPTVLCMYHHNQGTRSSMINTMNMPIHYLFIRIQYRYVSYISNTHVHTHTHTHAHTHTTRTIYALDSFTHTYIHRIHTQNTYTEYIHGAHTQESAVFRVFTPQKSKLW